MHLPDGFLDLTLSLAMFIIAVLFWIPSFYKTNKSITQKNIPLMGILTAGVFAAQMLNFPIIGGTSGHLLGGTLIAVFLGPYAAVVSMTIILLIQALLFGDGGLTALGANTFNMGIIAVFIGFGIYYLLRKYIKGEKGMLTGIFIASWISVILASIACGVELGLSSIFPYGLEITIPAMTFWHIIIGFGEGLISLV
ncbi:MAG: energy-coupling factor ABC transporter permease, partial [Candidatus Odinarchaeia archaeon]